MKRFFILSLFFAFAINFNAQTKLPPLGIENPNFRGRGYSSYYCGPRTKTLMDNGESPFLNKDATRFLENAVRENNVTKATKFLEAGASAFISYEMIDKKQYEMIDVMHKDNPKLIRYSQLLHHACAKSDAEMIDFLIERGASLDLYGYHVELYDHPEWDPWSKKWTNKRVKERKYLLTSKLWNGDRNYKNTPADVALIYMRLDNLKHIKDKYNKYPTIYGLNHSLLNSVHEEKMIRLILSDEFQNNYVKPAGYKMADVINFGYHWVHFENGGQQSTYVKSVYLINSIIQKIGEYRNNNNKEMEKEYLNFLNLILAEGADVNKEEGWYKIEGSSTIDSGYLTPLYVAMRHKNMMDIVKLLRSKGAKMTTTRDGKTISLMKLNIYDEYKEYFMLEGE